MKQSANGTTTQLYQRGPADPALVFLAHDPGGRDAVQPVFSWFQERERQCRLFLNGPAGRLSPEYAAEAEGILPFLSESADEGKLAGVVTGTSAQPGVELDAIAFCHRRGIPTVSILDYWSNYALRFTSGEKRILPDQLFVMDALAENEAVADGLPPAILRVTGHPGLDAYLQAPVTPPQNKKIVFLSQPLSPLYGTRLGYTEFDAAEDVMAAGTALGYQVDFKFHPKETAQFREKYAARAVEGDIRAMVERYELLVGMSTMALLQAVLLGGKVVSYQPNLNGKDPCITNRLGLTKGAYSFDALKEQMESTEIGKLPAHLLWLDGKSTERCGTALERLFASRMNFKTHWE